MVWETSIELRPAYTVTNRIEVGGEGGSRTRIAREREAVAVIGPYFTASNEYSLPEARSH
jgi:hypothetical protein